jgi:hypothetical protein
VSSYVYTKSYGIALHFVEMLGCFLVKGKILHAALKFYSVTSSWVYNNAYWITLLWSKHMNTKPAIIFVLNIYINFGGAQAYSASILHLIQCINVINFMLSTAYIFHEALFYILPTTIMKATYPLKWAMNVNILKTFKQRKHTLNVENLLIKKKKKRNALQVTLS